MKRDVSDEKALAMQTHAQLIGQKIVKGYHNIHDAPKWTSELEEILGKLPITTMRKLSSLICDGPMERPDS